MVYFKRFPYITLLKKRVTFCLNSSLNLLNDDLHSIVKRPTIRDFLRKCQTPSFNYILMNIDKWWNRHVKYSNKQRLKMINVVCMSIVFIDLCPIYNKVLCDSWPCPFLLLFYGNELYENDCVQWTFSFFFLLQYLENMADSYTRFKIGRDNFLLHIMYIYKFV